MPQRLEREIIDLLDVLLVGRLARGDGGESAIEALAENDAPVEGASGLGRTATGVGPQGGGQLRRQKFRLLRKLYQVGVAAKVFSKALRKMATAHRVGEVKAKRAAAQIELIACLLFGNIHYFYCNPPLLDRWLGTNPCSQRDAVDFLWPLASLSSYRFPSQR